MRGLPQRVHDARQRSGHEHDPQLVERRARLVGEVAGKRGRVDIEPAVWPLQRQEGEQVLCGVLVA